MLTSALPFGSRSIRCAVALALPAALGVATLSPAAHADLPPPQGFRYVTYQFEVRGMPKPSEHVIIAYPWSTSNGAPTKEVTEVKDATPVPVGRRSAAPQLYAVSRAAWEAFAAKAPQDDAAYEAQAQALVKQAISCNVTVNPRFQLPATDGNGPITDIWNVQKLDGSGCVLVGPGAAPAPTATGATPTGTTPTGSTPSDNPPKPGSGDPRTGGCAGCVAAGHSGSSPVGEGLLLAAVGLAGWRVSRRRGVQPASSV